jgi:hypothetical protein
MWFYLSKKIHEYIHMKKMIFLTSHFVSFVKFVQTWSMLLDYSYISMFSLNLVLEVNKLGGISNFNS